MPVLARAARLIAFENPSGPEAPGQSGDGAAPGGTAETGALNLAVFKFIERDVPHGVPHSRLPSRVRQ
jgi:hypothetical protein